MAFTRGSNIVFREGQYRPHTFAGRQLLAHELTHTIQQGGQSSGAHLPQGYRISESGDRLEVRIQGLSPLVNTIK